MLVETSSSGKITTSGNPYVFRISPTSQMEATAFAPLFAKLGIKKADFLSTNNDFGLGAAKEFSEVAKANGVAVGAMETMDPKATDFSAQPAPDQGIRRRHAVRDDGGRTDHAGPQAAQGAAADRADHHHRRVEFA